MPKGDIARPSVNGNNRVNGNLTIMQDYPREALVVEVQFTSLFGINETRTIPRFWIKESNRNAPASETTVKGKQQVTQG